MSTAQNSRASMSAKRAEQPKAVQLVIDLAQVKGAAATAGGRVGSAKKREDNKTVRKVIPDSKKWGVKP